MSRKDYFETLTDFDEAVRSTDRIIKSRNDEIIQSRKKENDSEDVSEDEGGEVVEVECSEEYYKALLENCSVEVLNAQDKNGLTALHIAAASNNKKMARCLIDAGIDVSITDNRGVKALNLARLNGNEEIEEMIGEKLVYLITAPPSSRVESPTVSAAIEMSDGRY